MWFLHQKGYEWGRSLVRRWKQKGNLDCEKVEKFRLRSAPLGEHPQEPAKAEDLPEQAVHLEDQV